MNSFDTFLQLHKNATPLLLGNIWDVQSAKLFEANGYKAIGTSSLAVAKSMGYEDGEQLAFSSLLSLAKRVVESVRIPFTVDMEGGYSRSTADIINNIQKLHDAGVAGINLEDTIITGGRHLQPVTDFQKMLSAITEHLSRNHLKMFINIRTDGFLLGLPSALAETVFRSKAYEAAGADGIFVPCITKTNDIREIVSSTSLPVNVMCMPGLPGFAELEALGVKRISMGGFFFNAAYEQINQLSKKIVTDQKFSSIV
ncbi:MAG: isocitrate lyase/phosphoenolpyruvate mutase family protein [Bacteroidota bacterium]